MTVRPSNATNKNITFVVSDSSLIQYRSNTAGKYNFIAPLGSGGTISRNVSIEGRTTNGKTATCAVKIYDYSLYIACVNTDIFNDSGTYVNCISKYGAVNRSDLLDDFIDGTVPLLSSLTVATGASYVNTTSPQFFIFKNYVGGYTANNWLYNGIIVRDYSSKANGKYGFFKGNDDEHLTISGSSMPLIEYCPHNFNFHGTDNDSGYCDFYFNDGMLPNGTSTWRSHGSNGIERID